MLLLYYIYGYKVLIYFMDKEKDHDVLKEIQS